MRNKVLVAAATSLVATFGLGLNAGLAAAAPSVKADCVAQLISLDGAGGGVSGLYGPTPGLSVSAEAQIAHDRCFPRQAT